MMNNNNNHSNMTQNSQNLLTSIHNEEINTLKKKIELETHKSSTNEERINETKKKIEAVKKRLEEKKEKLVQLEKRIVEEKEKGEQEPLLYANNHGESESSEQEPHHHVSHTTTNITNEHIMAQLREHFKALKMQFQDLDEFDDDDDYEDEVDVDNMTYEELLELGEKIGKVSKGLDVKKMQCLEVKKYHKSEETKEEDAVIECAICREELEEEIEIIELPCGHIFHSECIKGWLNVEKHCPNCKREINIDNNKTNINNNNNNNNLL